MGDPAEKPHYHQHRKRIRERFRKNGLDAFEDYECVELLLTYTLPRKDVKPIAKELIKRFGSFRGVLEAPVEELQGVDGLGETAALFWPILREAAVRFLKQELVLERKRLSGTSDLLDYCRAVMNPLKDEQFRTIFLDSENAVICDEVIHEGTVNRSAVHPRKVMERALFHGASAMVFVHNHPSGACRPSKEDRAVTMQLLALSESLQIRVLDHLIVCAKGGYYSFFEKGQL